MRIIKQEKNSLTELDLTPLLDIIFLVLVFFMVAATFEINRSLNVQLPESVLSESNLSREVVLIEVDNNNSIFINGEPATQENFISTINTIENYTELTYILAADKNTYYQSIVFILDSLKMIGIKDLNIATDEKL